MVTTEIAGSKVARKITGDKETGASSESLVETKVEAASTVSENKTANGKDKVKKGNTSKTQNKLNGVVNNRQSESDIWKYGIVIFIVAVVLAGAGVFVLKRKKITDKTQK